MYRKIMSLQKTINKKNNYNYFKMINQITNPNNIFVLIQEEVVKHVNKDNCKDILNHRF
jgi:hypothetical protein